MPYTTTEPKIFYQVSGQGPAIVWSHGLMMDREMFNEQVNQFSKNYTCIVWDERAHGKTATDECLPFSYYDSAADLMRILDDLGLESAILAGMSQGGYLSLRAALRYPKRVRGLILIATQAQRDSGIDEEYQARYQMFREKLQMDHLDEECIKAVAEVIMDPEWPQTQDWIAKWRKMAMHNARAAFVCLSTRDDIQPNLSQIKVPCIAIHGSNDLSIPLASAKLMSDALPDCELYVVQGENHGVNMSSPGEVNRAIEGFLAERFDPSR